MMPQEFQEWPHAYRVSRIDSRFSYCCYLPKSSHGVSPLLVVVHGSERDGMAMRDALIEFSEATGISILAPLFPVSPYGDNNGDGYKYLIERDLRYDLILLDMVEELRQRANILDSRFVLFGFSGGAIFSHLFALLHSHELSGLVVGAPGHVGLIDPKSAWPHGTADIKEIFDIDEEFSRASFPILLLVGDTDNKELQVRPNTPYRGRNRHQRLASLNQNYHALGLDVSIEHVPDCGHEWRPMIPLVTAFLKTKFENRFGGQRLR